MFLDYYYMFMRWFYQIRGERLYRKWNKIHLKLCEANRLNDYYNRLIR